MGLGRGRLISIVVTSWALWISFGLGLFALLVNRSRPMDGNDPSPGRMVLGLIFISWLIEGAVLRRLIWNIASSPNRSRTFRMTLIPMAVDLAILVSSFGLILFGHGHASTRIALLIASGPLVAIGGVYGVFISIFVLSGARPN